ncbi:MAG: PAS domain S-box protein [Cyanobacteriota bacterium]|nr:PAS domain S-box protein [Cyanobacteriota bacterium]
MKFRFFPHITATLTALAILGAVSILECRERTRFQQAYRFNVLNKLSAVGSALESHLDRHLAVSRGLVAYVSTHPEIDEAEFQRLVPVLLAQQSNIESASLTKDGLSSYTYFPRDRTFDRIELEPEQQVAIDRSIESRSSIVEPPITLPDGRLIVTERAPIFVTPLGTPPESGTYWGTVSLRLDLTTVLQEIGALNPHTNLEYSLRGNDISGRQTVFAGDATIFERQPKLVDVKLPQDAWQLAAIPKEGWTQESPLLWWLRGGGGLLAFLAGIGVFKAIDDPRRQRQVLELKTSRLQTARDLFQEVLEHANCAVVRLDVGGNMTYLNPRARSLLGSAEEELLGQPFKVCVPPTADAQTHPLLEAIERSLTYPYNDFDRDAKIRCRNGKTLWMEWRGKAIVDPLGQVVGVVCLGYDISQRAMAELELRASESQMRALIAAMTDPIFVLNDRGDFVDMAPTHPDVAIADPTGKTLEDIFSPDRAREFLDILQKVLSTQTTHSFEYSLTIDDREVWFGASLSPMSENTVIWVARDISARVLAEAQLRSVASELEQRVEERAGQIQQGNKKLQIEIVERMQVEEALRESEARKREKAQQLEEALEKLKLTQAQLVHTEKMSGLGQLAAGMAHEINNPVGFIHGNLAHIRGYARDLLETIDIYREEYPQENDRIEEWLEEIELDFLQEDIYKTLESMEAGTDRIRNIILSLRNFSRLDESGTKRVDVCEGIESTLLMVQHRFHRQSNWPEIELIREFADLPKVECYASQLNQVFAHIISNAIDALDEQRGDWTDKPNNDERFPAVARPAIRIRTQAIGDERIGISIADNGPGIPPESISKIFNPFFTTKDVGKGTGLGLSISHQIITDTHGGTLDCASEPGCGTCFQIELPLRNLALA